jgi:hypothetical protein
MYCTRPGMKDAVHKIYVLCTAVINIVQHVFSEEADCLNYVYKLI